MELFEARDHFIVQRGEYALWCNRFDGSLTARRGKVCCLFDNFHQITLVNLVNLQTVQSQSQCLQNILTTRCT